VETKIDSPSFRLHLTKMVPNNCLPSQISKFHLTKMVFNNCLPSHISKFISGFYSRCFLWSVTYISIQLRRGGRRDVKGDSGLDLTPPNKTPMLLNTSTKCNLLTLASAHRGSKLQLCQVILHGNYSGPR